MPETTKKHQVTMPRDKMLEYLDTLTQFTNDHVIDPGYTIALRMALKELRIPSPANKTLTVEELRERTKPVWCSVHDCSWIPEGGFYCLCEKGMIIPPSKQTFSAEECLENGWQLLDRPPEKENRCGCNLRGESQNDN